MTKWHTIQDVILLGLQSLTVHLARSTLTVLGILFGVWSVIAMLAINEGAARRSQDELAKLGSDNLIIESIKPPQKNQQAGQTQRAAQYGLTRADAARLRENVPGVVRCTVVHRTTKSAIVPHKKVPVTVLATEPSYLRAARLRLDSDRSRFLTHVDMLRRHNVCVITADLARTLYGPEDPIGQTLRLEREPFVVVGVASRPARVRIGLSVAAAHQVFIPRTTEIQRYGDFTFTRMQGSMTFEKVEISQAILQMRNEDDVLNAALIVRPLLSRYHDRLDYEVKVPLEEIGQMKAQARLWNYMFFAIAAVSLIVGGIGIMNIMLASVTERTREIGIRRALGAKKGDIVAQFLVESVTLTTLGGAMGILVGAVAVPAIVHWMLDLEAVVEWPTLALPFAMALIVGLASGLYPAIRAAALDPIVALRHE